MRFARHGLWSKPQCMQCRFPETTKHKSRLLPETAKISCQALCLTHKSGFSKVFQDSQVRLVSCAKQMTQLGQSQQEVQDDCFTHLRRNLKRP